MSEETKSTEEATVSTSETKTEAASTETKTEARDNREGQGQQRDGQRPQRDGQRPQRQGGFQRNPRFKRKVCKFCFDKKIKIDYKDAGLLEQFITDRGKILPRRVTGTCAKHQRGVAEAIKRARIIALLPFIEK